MRATTLLFLILAGTLVVVYAAIQVTPGEGKLLQTAGQSQGYTTLSLIGNQQPGWVSFAIANHGAADRVYTYSIYTTFNRVESLAASGTAAVNAGMTSDNSYPIDAQHVERVRVTLEEEQQEVAYSTGYTYREWKPAIDPNMPWKRQDPLVQHFYKYVTDAPRSKDYPQ